MDPVSLANNSFGSSLSQLPVDPVNTISSRLWYTYETDANGKFEVTTPFESTKYKLGGANDQVSGDGGTLATVYEKGSRLGLEPLDYGDASLVGLWNFEEGSSSVAYDWSGNNSTGTWIGNATGTNGYYSAGRVGNWAGVFDGATTYINAGNASSLQLSVGTISAWIKTSGSASVYDGIVIKQSAYGIFLISGTFSIYDWGGGGNRSTGINLFDGTWHFVACTFQSGVSNGTLCYLDGVIKMTTTMTVNAQTFALALGAGVPTGSQFFPGLIDDARVYNRVLSAAELAALYNGGK